MRHLNTRFLFKSNPVLSVQIPWSSSWWKNSFTEPLAGQESTQTFVAWDENSLLSRQGHAFVLTYYACFWTIPTPCSVLSHQAHPVPTFTATGRTGKMSQLQFLRFSEIFWDNLFAEALLIWADEEIGLHLDSNVHATFLSRRIL